ncbi:MAG: 30S ribosomal protein S8e [Candidatus Pacearchaeota archaeon]|jgi:small subunit ribosomal protein S8e
MGYGRKISGGKYKILRKTKKFELVGIARKVKLGKTKQKVVRGQGGNKKNILLTGEFANVYNPSTKKSKKAKIKNVLETPSNRFWARQNILIKSAVIETDIGKAKITNRPSQEGTINAILIE